MKLFRACMAVLILLVGLGLAGCCCTGGKEKETVVVPTQSTTTTPTIGKELEDLEQAYKKGTITKEEFESGKKNLLEKGAPPAK